MIIFKQIIILLVIVQFLSVPLVILWILYEVVGLTTPLNCQIQGVSVTLSQCLIPISLAFFTPQIRDKFKRNQRQARIHPVTRQARRLEVDTVNRIRVRPQM